MRVSQLGGVIALVAATRAFLLPPTITEASSDIINTLPFEDVVSIKDRVMEVNCPDCPIAIADVYGKMHSAQVESVLRLNFSVSFSDKDKLLLNDVQIYPVEPLSISRMEGLTADQLVKSPAGTWEYASSANLGYCLKIAHPPVTSNNEQLDLVTIKLTINQVADKSIHGIPPVILKLLETPSGKLMIGDAEILRAVPSNASAPSDSDKECTSTLCKWTAIIADKLSKIKGCAGKNRQDAPGKHAAGLRPHGHGRPRPHGPHGPHQHHLRRGGIARLLRSIVLHVFIPIMIGVVVGVTTSLIGIVVGHLIVFIWRVLFRRGQRGQYHRVQPETLYENGKDKTFSEPQGPPPSYEEAPACEDALVVEKPY